MKSTMKFLGCFLAFLISLPTGGIVAQILHLNLQSPRLKFEPNFPALLIAGAVLTAGLVPLTRGLAGSKWLRAGTIATFLFLALGVNTVIEASVFSTILQGVVPGNIVMYLIQALLMGTALGLSFGAAGEGTGLRRCTPAGWLGRGLIAWLGWPVTYLTFGMCVAPFVTSYYQTLGWLHIPPITTMIETQLVRSVIFAASSLPAIALWKGSRLGLWGALGLAHAVAVGLYGLISGTFLPAVLRISHSVEITCDSFAYAGLLVLLFSGATAKSKPIHAAALQQHSARVVG